MAERRCISGTVSLGRRYASDTCPALSATPCALMIRPAAVDSGPRNSGDDEIQLLVETGLLRQQPAVGRLERREPIAVPLENPVRGPRVARPGERIGLTFVQRVGGEGGGAVRLHPALDQPVAHRRGAGQVVRRFGRAAAPPPGGGCWLRPVAREEPHDLIAVRVRVQPELLAQRLDFQRVLRRRELIGDCAGIEQQLVLLRRVCVGDRCGLLLQQLVRMGVVRGHRRQQLVLRQERISNLRGGKCWHRVSDALK